MIKKGKVLKNCVFKISDERIPTVSEAPVKSLGKMFDDTLKDGNNKLSVIAQIEKWLLSVDESELSGKFKVWIFQHGILPRILWPLMLYDFPLSTVEKMESKISNRLHQWLGVSPSFSNAALYGKDVKLVLPMSSLFEEYKVTKARAETTLKESKNNMVSQAGITMNTGRKWDVSEAVSQAKSRLEHKEIVGMVCVGKQGIGYNESQQWWSKAKKRDKRDMLVQEIRNTEEGQRHTKAVSMQSQGAWMKWEEVLPKKITWSELWKMEPLRIKFCLRSVYDVLPTPTNLVKWGKTEDPNCKLCGKPCTLQHVLSSCNVALTQGRYTWRHNTVLQELASAIDRKLRCKKNEERTLIRFVKEGEKPNQGVKSTSGLLDLARDWELLVDTHVRLVIPDDIVKTKQRPDIVLFSRGSNIIIFIELTFPWEEAVEEAYERKLLRYLDLVKDCIANGWNAVCYPVEIGAWGFVARSMVKLMKELGMGGKERRTLIRRLGETTERSSTGYG